MFKVFFFLNLMLTFWCFGGFWPIFAKETYTWDFWSAAGAGREGAPPLSTPRVHQGIGLPCAPFESGHRKIWIRAFFHFVYLALHGPLIKTYFTKVVEVGILKKEMATSFKICLPAAWVSISYRNLYLVLGPELQSSLHKLCRIECHY